MRSLRACARWVPDGLVIVGVLLGIALVSAPGSLGFHLSDDDPARRAVGVGAVEAPWFLLPLVGAAIMWAALRASAHAETIAHRLRDPFGTLVLTISAISIEVVLVVAVMTAGHSCATVARDTMFATLMVILNGLVGVALIAGALKKRELSFNQQSSSAYLSMIAALCTVGLVLPRFTTSAPGGYMAAPMETFVAGASLAVYAAFVALQSSAHRDFFVLDLKETPARAAGNARAVRGHRASLTRPIVMLLLALATVILLADGLGDLLVDSLQRASLPASFQGVAIAVLILLPEGIAAVRSALSTNVQRTINILHGSALATIGLTIPAVLIVSHSIGSPVELGLEPPEITLLVATIMVAMIQFGQGRTNLMHGLVHAMLFMLWLALLLDEESTVARSVPFVTPH